MCLERVGSNNDGSAALVRFEEGECLARREEIPQLLREEWAVPVVVTDLVVLEKFLGPHWRLH